jgi:DNA polymerase-3 subunit gamma/tau
VQKPQQPSCFSSFEEFVEWVGHQREGILHGHLFYDVHPVHFSPPHVTLRLSEKAPRDLSSQLQELVQKKTGDAWTIAISDEIGQPTLCETKQKAREEKQNEILQAPLVKLLIEAFPGTTLVQLEDS